MVVALTVLMAVLAGSIYGAVYNAQEVQHMAKNVNTLSAAEAANIRETQGQAESHKELAKFVSEATRITADDFLLLTETGWDRATVDLAERRVTMLEEAINGMLQGHLVPAALNDVDVRRTSEGITSYAQSMGMQPLAKYYADYMQMETSFYSTEEGFKLFIHIPLMHKGSELRIFRHARVPIPVGHGFQVTLESEKEFLAISSDDSLFRAMTANELAECTRKGDFFACKVGNVVRRAPRTKKGTFGKDPDLCLWSLYTQSYSIAKQTCITYVNQAPDTVVQLSANRFVIFNAEPHQARMDCRNNSIAHRKRFTVHGITDINIPAGCTVNTDSHAFSASDVAFTRPADHWAVEYAWPQQPRQLLNGLNLDYLNNITMKTNILGNSSRIPLEHVLERISALNPMPVQEGMSFPTLSWMPHSGLGLTFIVAMVALVLTIWQLCRKNKLDLPPVFIPTAPLQRAMDNFNSLKYTACA
jgi:hypothetical protein